jgi:peptidoglycan/LPS O-acetylase OafA/YrhL
MRRGENFHLLDGLRGIAALAVILYHASQFLAGRPSKTPAYLAVDFFFMLSGFVVCAAYGHRLDSGLTWRRFLAIRFIRLGPMLVIGALLGGLVWTLNRFKETPPLAALGDGLLITLSAALLLPGGLLLGLQAYPADNPIWSLFFEILANALYAVRIRARAVLWTAATLACVLVLGFAGWRWGSLETFGFNDPVTFLLGLPRVIVPFALGVLIYRRGFHRFFAGCPAWLPALLLALVLGFGSRPAWIFDLAATLLAFPLVVAAGAGSRVAGWGQRLTSLSGELSYPAYLVHQPILRGLRAAERFAHLRLPFALATVLAIAVTLALSWALLKYVDQPVRRALERRFLHEKRPRDVLLQPAL